MIRVAAVAKQICDTSTVALDTDAIVSGCLVHDMGNLIKAKMDSFPEFFAPEGAEYWQQVKDEMIATYGSNVHVATIAMVKDLQLDDLSYKYFMAIGSEATERVHQSGNLGEKIATYSDMRVGPFGIVSLNERMNDMRTRYLDRGTDSFKATEIDLRESRLKDMEEEIFAQAKIQPGDVTDESTAAIQAELWDWKLKTIN